MFQPRTLYRFSTSACVFRTAGAALAALLICSALQNAAAQTIQIPGAESLSLTTDVVASRRFVAVHGRRALMDGDSASGLEVWAYPIELIRGYRVGFRPEGATSEIPGSTILQRIVYRPSEVVRIYIGPNFIVREKLFVPLHVAGAVLTYTVVSSQPVDVIVHFVPVLNLMWPAGSGGQDVSWSQASSGYVLTEQTHRFSAVIGSSNVIAHDEIFNRANSSRTPVSLAFTIRAGGETANQTATVVVASSDGNPADIRTLVQKLTDNRSDMENQAIAHYEGLQSKILQIETPDAVLNKDLAWSEVALDQAWVCNPDLGCGLVAGYGPSRGARRPQYAWFFAGDGMVAARALLSAGEYARAREELNFIAKYQDKKTGMIWHELSQSAGLIDWAGKYPYMFVHVDISFQYINTVADYVAASGDKAFLQSHWRSVEAAYRYCQSLIDPQNGLPQIPPGKEGGDEQDRMSDELTLSASWIQASESFARMAAWMGYASQAAQAIKAEGKARKSAAARYWDQKSDFWIDGFSPSGKQIVSRSSSGVVAIADHIFSPPQEESLLNQLASPNFQTDWGTRSTARNSVAFNPNSYAKGSVWAVGTANVAIAFWMNHRPAAALDIWRGLVPWSTLDSLGHMDEVLAGDYYHEQTESVPEQTWSSAAFFSSAVQGLLGLTVDGLTRTLAFSPRIPADWNTVNLRNIQIPGAKVALMWCRTKDGSDLETINSGQPIHLIYSPEVSLGSQLTGATWNGQPIPARLNEHGQASDVKIEISVPHGTAHLRLDYAGGVSLMVSNVDPLLGNSSRAIRVIGVTLRGDTYIVNADVDPSRVSTFQLRTGRKITAVHGATWTAVSKNTYTFSVAATRSSAGRSSDYNAVEILVDFTPRHGHSLSEPK
jgi:glycogen debranching enzyme